MNKRWIYIFSLGLMINGVAAEKMKKVCVNQFVAHPALDATTKGVIDGLAQQGYTQGRNVEVRVESAQANSPLASQISMKFVSQGADVVVGVATVSAQSLSKYAKEQKTKLVFSSVTDPLGAGLVQSLEKPGDNTSGVSNFVALAPQLHLFQQIQPQLKRLGILYNPSEANSLSLIKQLQALCAQQGIVLVLQAAHRTSEVAPAATKLAAHVDAIFISNDNTALSALQAIINAGNKAKIPVYVSDTDAVALGALAALGPNQYNVGVQTGKMVARCLNGTNPGEIPVEFPERTELYLNESAAEKIGLQFPPALQAAATRIITEKPQ